MKTRITILFTLLVCNLYVSAQEKLPTIYYDSLSYETTKEHYSYYRESIKTDSCFLVNEYYKNGVLKMKGSFNLTYPEIKHGYFFSYREDGSKVSEEYYYNNKMYGLVKSYWENGNLKDTGRCNNGKMVGAWRYFYKSGAEKMREDRMFNKLEGERVVYYEGGIIKRKETYKNDSLLEGKCFTKTGRDTTYFPYQIMPCFPGEDKGLMDYMQSNVNYPRAAKNERIMGTVYVYFEIGKEGKVQKARVIKGVEHSIDKEALRVINEMPKWSAGYEDGVPCVVSFTYPVKFVLR